MLLAVTRMDVPDDAETTSVQRPNWREIESAIRRLNGENCSLVILGVGEPPVPHMAIGGGASGRYIVYATKDNLSFQQLTNPAALSGKCTVVAGGQSAEYEWRFCVGLGEALRAARTYAESGECESALAWVDSRARREPRR